MRPDSPLGLLIPAAACVAFDSSYESRMVHEAPRSVKNRTKSTDSALSGEEGGEQGWALSLFC